MTIDTCSPVRLAQDDALEVPAHTLLVRAEGPQVALVGAGGRIHLQSVTIGKDFGQTVQIVVEIGKTDELAVNPADGLAEGNIITVRHSVAVASAPH